nr:NADH dehydrogenase subunit 6 [Megacopta lobata]
MWYTMMSLMTSLSITMMFMKHPVSMGLILILQTITIAMITGMMTKTFLFSYIITIIMMSGALVLFIYMASVASNEKFKPSIMISMMSMSITMIVWMMQEPIHSKNYNFQESKIMIKMYNSSPATMTMMMIIFLLFTMIVVSSMASVKEGPLRTKT